MSVVEQVPVFEEDVERNATRVARTDIVKCRVTEAEGFAVNTGAEDGFLRAFVVLLGAPVTAVQEKIVGTLAAASTAGTYTLTPSEAGALAVCVRVDDETEIVELTISGDGTTVGAVAAAVPVGVEVTVIGVRDGASDCFAADTIIHEA